MKVYPEVRLAREIKERDIAREDREFHGEPEGMPQLTAKAAHRLLKDLLGSEDKIDQLLAIRKKVWAKLN